jgi:hypothetical protein
MFSPDSRERLFSITKASLYQLSYGGGPGAGRSAVAGGWATDSIKRP